MSRHEQIKAKIFDLLRTLQFMKPGDKERAERIMAEVIDKVDQIVEGELTNAGVKKK